MMIDESKTTKTYVLDRFKPMVGKMAEGARVKANSEQEAMNKAKAMFSDAHNRDNYFIIKEVRDA